MNLKLLIKFGSFLYWEVNVIMNKFEFIRNTPYNELKDDGVFFVKPNVFISHITEEKELALILKEEIKNRFFNGFNIFVSSDGNSIEAGSEWFNTISKNLKSADIMIVLTSKEAVNRPWISFELGVGWSKSIPTIPLCHTDMIVGQLPSPINQLQALSASNKENISQLFRIMNEKINQSTDLEIPLALSLPDDMFMERIFTFEKKYGFVNKALVQIESIQENTPDLNGFFDEGNIGKDIIIDIRENVYNKIEPHFNSLQKMGVIEFEKNPGGNIRMDGWGSIFNVAIRLEEKYSEITNKK